MNANPGNWQGTYQYQQQPIPQPSNQDFQPPSNQNLALSESGRQIFQQGVSGSTPNSWPQQDVGSKRKIDDTSPSQNYYSVDGNKRARSTEEGSGYSNQQQTSYYPQNQIQPGSTNQAQQTISTPQNYNNFGPNSTGFSGPASQQQESAPQSQPQSQQPSFGNNSGSANQQMYNPPQSAPQQSGPGTSYNNWQSQQGEGPPLAGQGATSQGQFQPPPSQQPQQHPHQQLQPPQQQQQQQMRPPQQQQQPQQQQRQPSQQLQPQPQQQQRQPPQQQQVQPQQQQVQPQQLQPQPQPQQQQVQPQQQQRQPPPQLQQQPQQQQMQPPQQQMQQTPFPQPGPQAKAPSDGSVYQSSFEAQSTPSGGSWMQNRQPSGGTTQELQGGGRPNSWSAGNQASSGGPQSSLQFPSQDSQVAMKPAPTNVVQSDLERQAEAIRQRQAQLMAMKERMRSLSQMGVGGLSAEARADQINQLKEQMKSLSKSAMSSSNAPAPAPAQTSGALGQTNYARPSSLLPADSQGENPPPQFTSFDTPSTPPRVGSNYSKPVFYSENTDKPTQGVGDRNVGATSESGPQRSDYQFSIGTSAPGKPTPTSQYPHLGPQTQTSISDSRQEQQMNRWESGQRPPNAASGIPDGLQNQRMDQWESEQRAPNASQPSQDANPPESDLYQQYSTLMNRMKRPAPALQVPDQNQNKQEQDPTFQLQTQRTQSRWSQNFAPQQEVGGGMSSVLETGTSWSAGDPSLSNPNQDQLQAQARRPKEVEQAQDPMQAKLKRLQEIESRQATERGPDRQQGYLGDTLQASRNLEPDQEQGYLGEFSQLDYAPERTSQNLELDRQQGYLGEFSQLDYEPQQHLVGYQGNLGQDDMMNKDPDQEGQRTSSTIKAQLDKLKKFHKPSREDKDAQSIQEQLSKLKKFQNSWTPTVKSSTTKKAPSKKAEVEIKEENRKAATEASVKTKKPAVTPLKKPAATQKKAPATSDKTADVKKNLKEQLDKLKKFQSGQKKTAAGGTSTKEAPVKKVTVTKKTASASDSATKKVVVKKTVVVTKSSSDKKLATSKSAPSSTSKKPTKVVVVKDSSKTASEKSTTKSPQGTKVVKKSQASVTKTEPKKEPKTLDEKKKYIQDQLKKLKSSVTTAAQRREVQKAQTELQALREQQEAEAREQRVAEAIQQVQDSARRKVHGGQLLGKLQSVSERVEVLKEVSPSLRLGLMMQRPPKERFEIWRDVGTLEQKKMFKVMSIRELGMLMDHWPASDRAELLKGLTPSQRKQVFMEISVAEQAEIASRMTDDQHLELMDVLTAPEQVAYLGLLSADKQVAVLRLKNYQERGTLFGLMTPDHQLQMLGKLAPQEVVQIISCLRPEEQMRLLMMMNIQDRMQTMVMLKPEEQLELILLMSRDQQEQVIALMSTEEHLHLVSSMTPQQQVQLLSIMRSADQAKLLIAMPPEHQNLLMSLLSPAEQMTLASLVKEHEQIMLLQKEQQMQQMVLGQSPGMIGQHPQMQPVNPITNQIDPLGMPGQQLMPNMIVGSQQNVLSAQQNMMMMQVPVVPIGAQAMVAAVQNPQDFFRQDNYLQNTEHISWPNWRVQCALSVDLRKSSGLMIPCNQITFTDIFNNGYVCPIEVVIKAEVQVQKTPIYIYNIENEEVLGAFVPVALQPQSPSTTKIWMDRAIYFPAIKITQLEGDEWQLILQQLALSHCVPLFVGVVQRICDRLCTALGVASAGLADMILQRHFANPNKFNQGTSMNPKLAMYLQQMALRKTLGDAVNLNGESADWLAPWKATLFNNPRYNLSQMKQIVKDKRIMFIGDSNTRGVYKDFVACCQGTDLVTTREYKQKGEPGYRGDRLVKVSNIGNSTQYEEIREYPKHPPTNNKLKIQYHFVTRCWSKKMIIKLQEAFNSLEPDVIIMNSCLWDTTRYHDNEDDSIADYIRNLSQLAEFLNVNYKGIFLWYSCFPVSPKVNAALFGPMAKERQLKQIAQLSTLVPVSNKLSTVIMKSRNFEVIDFWKLAIQDFEQRLGDGCHWSPLLHREATFQLMAFLETCFRRPVGMNR